RPAQRPEPSPPEPEPQAPEGPQAGAEGPPSPEASRSPARGAYLQSLEPSSRRWVLGGAKPPDEATLGPGAAGSREPAGAAPASPPNKASRTKSPGPARRLSMKMKKLPELRRRLSLRSTRAGRERERAAPAGSVISRYHLDSSVGTPGRAAVSEGARGLRADFLRLDHTFHLELEAARLLRALVLAWDPGVRRHRPCAQGCEAQQLAVRLEPQGLLYAKLTLSEQQEAPGTAEPRVFGLPLPLLVEREQSPGQVPLIIQKCVGQIERRGLRVVGLYRLCGSAAVKKELRDAFERDSAAVCLSEDLYPDINVITGQHAPSLSCLLPIQPSPQGSPCGPSGTSPLLLALFSSSCTYPPPVPLLPAPAESPASETSSALIRVGPVSTGILKDYLRELPTPLITQPLYQVVLEAMAREPPSRAPSSTEGTRGLLSCLPDVERATLTLLLDHLRLVSSFHAHNRMTPQNLAVCFDPRRPPEAPELVPYLRPKRQPPLHLPLASPEVVTRPRGRGGPESPPSNRYAGDWSVCGRDFLPCGRDFLSGPDYDHVTGSDSEDEDEEAGEPTVATDFEDDFEAPFNPHLNLKDFDALIMDLERELSKQINVCL
ncbi:hypothetical protein E2I00_005715, partial [Balaenoptera physalus]